MTSELEHYFAIVIVGLLGPGLPTPVTEFRFCPPRRWKFDFVWKEERVAVEIEGGTFSGGRHTRSTGFTGDCQKYNQAVLRGWRVLRYTGEMLQNDPQQVVDELRSLLATRVPNGQGEG